VQKTAAIPANSFGIYRRVANDPAVPYLGLPDERARLHQKSVTALENTQRQINERGRLDTIFTRNDPRYFSSDPGLTANAASRTATILLNRIRGVKATETTTPTQRSAVAVAPYPGDTIYFRAANQAVASPVVLNGRVGSNLGRIQSALEKKSMLDADQLKVKSRPQFF